MKKSFLISILGVILLSCNCAFGQKYRIECPKGKQNIVVTENPAEREKGSHSVAIFLWDSLTREPVQGNGLVTMKASGFEKKIKVQMFGGGWSNIENMPKKVEFIVECPGYRTIKQELKIPVPSHILIRLVPNEVPENGQNDKGKEGK